MKIIMVKTVRITNMQEFFRNSRPFRRYHVFKFKNEQFLNVMAVIIITCPELADVTRTQDRTSPHGTKDHT